MYHAGEGPADTFSALGAFGVVCAATATMLVGAVVATSAGAPAMVTAIVAQLAMLAVPLVALERSGRTRAALGLRRPAGRYVVAGVLIGASAWYLNMRLVALLPIPDTDAQLLELIDRPSLPVVLLAVGLAPAICEEVLFRGVLARGLATRFVLPIAVVLAAIVFSLYHVRLVQLLPTFTLGLALGVLAIRARSAIPGMLAHLLNNTIALLVARGEVPAVAHVLERFPAAAVVGFTIVFALGLSLVSRPRPT